MDQGGEGQFKVPDSEPQPSVDNFSPPGGKEEAKPSAPLEMPKEGETKSLKAESEEVEDVFEEPQKTTVPPASAPPPPPPPPTPTPKPVAKATPPPNSNKIDLPQQKRGVSCLWIIVLLLLFVLLGVIIALNEFGVFNLGLEKYYGLIRLERLWHGLPIDSKAAIADSLSKMEGKSFNLEGSTKADLYLASSQNEAAGVWNQGVELKGDVNLKAKIQSKDRMEFNLTSEVNSESTPLKDLLVDDSAINLTAVYDSSDVYLQSQDLKKILSLDKDWLKVKANASSSSGTKEAKLAEIATGGERIGWDVVDGTACYVYELRINSSAANTYLANNLPVLSWLGKDASYQSVKFYLGKRDHLIHKLEAVVNHNLGTSSLSNRFTVYLKGIGSNLEVSIPDKGEVVEKSWDDVKKAVIFGSKTSLIPANNTPEERDETRKADLKKIQDALLAYKVQNGKYPSTSGQIEKTKDVSSNLKTALVPGFIESLPLDPIPDKYYYGYKSDNGTSCELSSVLEIRSDPEGEEVSGFWLYKLIGN